MTKNMIKKIIVLLIFVLILAGGGFFWWQNQKDVRELNKTLPEGVKVVKSLIGEEYKVVNKIDGYEFEVPMEWRGISEIEYVPERTEGGYTGASISVEGNEGMGRIITIDRFRVEKFDVSLEQWAKDNFETLGLVGDFKKDTIKEFEVVKTQENVHLLGMPVYFFHKKTAVYAITGGSEDFIREIITNGKW